MGHAWALSTARHPQFDGETERANRIAEDVLRHFISPTMADGEQHLSLVQIAIDNAWQETVQEMPHFLSFGLHPKTPLIVGLPARDPAKNPTAGDSADELQRLTARAKKFTLAAQQQHKKIGITFVLMLVQSGAEVAAVHC